MMSHQEEYPRVPYLPLTKVIPGLGAVSIEHFHDAEIPEIYEMVCGAARRGEDIGVDEYPSLDDWMERIYMEALAAGIITVRHRSTKVLKAAIHFHCSRFSRSLTPCLAETKLVMADGVRKKPDTFLELVTLSEQLVRDSGCGFVGTTIESFIHNHDSIKALRSARFHVTCTMPALVKAPKIGLTESVIFYKDFGTPFPQVCLPVNQYADPTCSDHRLFCARFDRYCLLPWKSWAGAIT